MDIKPNGSIIHKEKSGFQKFVKSLSDNKFLFIIFIGVFLIMAFLKNRYTTPIYLVGSTISIKEPDNLSNSTGNLLLQKEANVGGMPADVTNEIAILTSYPFILKTVEALNFRISYFKEGNINTNEIYEKLPFTINIKDTSLLYKIVGNRYRVIFVDKNNYAISDVSTKKDENALKKYRVGNFVNLNGCVIKVEKTKFFNTQKDINLNFEFLVNDLSTLAFAFKSNLNVFSEEDGGNILSMEFRTPIPRKGIDFLNELSKQYIKDKYELKSRAAGQALVFINEQINSVKGTLGSTESNIASFKASNTFSDAASQTDRNLDAISQLENERASLTLNERYYSTLLNDLNSNSGLDQLVAPSSIGIQDGLTENLMRQLADMQIEKNSYSANGNSKNPLVQDLDIKINSLKSTLKENLRSLASSNRTRLNQVNVRTSRYQSNVFNLPTAEKRYTDMKRISDFNDILYQFLMQKKVEAGILKASATVESKVLEPAFDMGTVVAPNKVNNYGLAFIIGFLIPFSYIRLKSALNTRVTSKDDILDYTTLPIVGSIYRNAEASPFVFDLTSRTPVSESFRILRSNLMYFAKDRSKRILLFSSVVSGEGKSFISTNIATSFALTKKKTILVNLDLRVPSKIYEGFGHSDIGITTFLNGECPLKDIIQTTSIPNLHFISTGELPINPSELLLENRLEEFFNFLRSTYDTIIVDTPPLGIVVDALIIARYSDINVIVVRERYSLKEKMSELEEMYKEEKMKNMCIVINDIKLDKKETKNAYYYSHKKTTSVQ
jgi:capsular exopolysaccharide synthesis family protein